MTNNEVLNDVIERYHDMGGTKSIDWDILFDAMDGVLTYDDARWDIMMFYMRPDEADWETARNLLTDDAVTAIENGGDDE